MRYRLRTLLIVLAVAPPLLWIGWEKYQARKAEQARQAVPTPRRLTLRTIQIVNGEAGLVEWTIETPIQ